MEMREEFKDFNIGKDPDLEDKIGQLNEYPLVYPGHKLPILKPGKAVRVRKDVSLLLFHINVANLLIPLDWQISGFELMHRALLTYLLDYMCF